MKTIAANVCSTWRRQRSAQAISLNSEDAGLPLIDGGPGPLEVALSREKQQEIYRALLQLPQANRLAVLMHVWGEYTYAEIAAFTDVPVTTVEGRIYRAKRQLQRLLYDEGAAFMTSGSGHRIPQTAEEHTYDKPNSR